MKFIFALPLFVYLFSAVNIVLLRFTGKDAQPRYQSFPLLNWEEKTWERR